jgi:hypothetical protein
MTLLGGKNVSNQAFFTFESHNRRNSQIIGTEGDEWLRHRSVARLAFSEVRVHVNTIKPI